MSVADAEGPAFLRRVKLGLFALAAIATAFNPPSAFSQTAQQPRIAIAVSATGAGAFYGSPALDGARMGGEEAGIEVSVHDDRSDPAQAREIARQIAASGALVVVGPATTAMSLAAGPLYAEAGLVSIGTTATGDKVTANATTFRASFTTGDGGEALANYLRHVLNGTRAIVIFRKDDYGLPVADGFRRAAERLGIDADYRPFDSGADIETIAAAAAADTENPAIVLAMLDQDAATVVAALRRRGVKGAILGTGAIAGEFFAARFTNEPEERKTPGFFTDKIYAAVSELFDSANAETLAFAERFRARYKRSPDFYAVQGYEAMRIAVAALKATAPAPGGAQPDLRARRDAVYASIKSLDGPERAVAGLNGPLWFTPERGREQALRMGRFHGTAFESAPIQLVPVRDPDAAEVAGGALAEIGPGRFARRQQVVFTGIFLNEIPRVDVAQSTFTADFYVWMRFAGGAGTAGSDPADIEFPGLARGQFDAARLAAQGNLDDGATYRLWQVRGDIKNDFDMRAYPFDRQTLVLRFFNARAASDRVVYVRDHRSIGSWAAPNVATMPSAGVQGPGNFPSTSADAFRNLSQWAATKTSQSRDSLVTQSALGDPRLVGLERVRELSGFSFSIDIRRWTLSTLSKTLLPLGLMTLILFASLYFPSSMATPKVTVIVTSVLAATVLLSSINAQLGGVGYVIYVEYAFYGFFFLCLMCMLAAFMIERYRLAGRTSAILVAERASRYSYVLVLAIMAIAVWLVYVRA